MADPANACDVLVVGAGPGGIAAAVTAAEAGRRVILVDDNPHAGGQIWRNRGDAPKSRDARQWLRRLSAAPNLVRLQQTRIVAQVSPKILLADTPAGPRPLSYHSLILATGARELFIPFPGWTLPGVVGAGALQALIKSGLPVKGKRVVVAGTGPLLLAVAALARERGATIPLIAEQTSAASLRRFARSLVRSPSKLLMGVSLRSKLLATRYATDSYVVDASVDGASLVVRVRVGRRDQIIECDYLACGFNLIANTELPRAVGCSINAAGFVEVGRDLETSLADTYAVGEITGVGGVDKAILEGRIAASAIVGNTAAVDALAVHRDASLAFARRLETAFALRSELFALAKRDTLICRCEDVPLSAIRSCMSVRDAKLRTRCGMGPCQGRICEPTVQRILGTQIPMVRPPIFPTPIATLAAAGEGADA